MLNVLKLLALVAAFVLVSTQAFSQQAPEPRHRFGIGVSYAGGDLVVPGAMFSGIYAYRFSPIIELEGNVHFFSNDSPPARMQQVDIGANISPFGGALRNLYIAPGIGLSRISSSFGGYQNIDPVAFLRIGYQIPLSEQLSLGIRAGSQVAYRPDFVRLPERVYQWSLSFSYIGATLTFSL
jgi:hypothetical protein